MMTLRFPSIWILQAHDAMARLADRPWLLFVVLLAVNAITRPYAGITHDTRLYSVQVLNRVEDGAYADDLFFRYGSQDNYSLFSPLAAPLVRAIGLPTAFFLIYLLSKTLLVWGMLRLVHTLVPNRTAGTLALLYCMIVSVRYGGQYVLNIQETFVTPRMLAIALVLIGLDLMLRQRAALSGLVLLAAAALHPLMAFGGLLMWAGFQAWMLLGGKALVLATIGLGILTASVLAYEPIALRLFGAMDNTWRQTVLHASSFNFPSEWGREDWAYLAVQFAILGIVIWKVRHVDVQKFRFLVLLAVVTLAAILGTVFAEQLPYALLLQGQPYRALWILAFLHLAFAFWLCVEWSQVAAPVVQLAGCALLVYLCWCNALAVELIFPICLWPCVALALRGLDRRPRDPAWLTHSIQLSLVIGGVGWMIYKVCLLTSSFDLLAHKHSELRDIVEVYIGNVGPIVVILVVAWGLVRFGAGSGRRVAWLAGTACLGVQLLFFAVPEADFYAEHCTRFRGDLRRIRTRLHDERDASAPLPTVYSNLGCLDYVWLDLHAKSYFDWWQAGGFMFRREMAVEGQRRACLVAPFEVARFRKFEAEMTDGDKEVIGRFFKRDFDRVVLDERDLARLCQEPGLDYLLLEQSFDGLYTAQYGQLYLYKCERVRIALGLQTNTNHENTKQGNHERKFAKKAL